MDGLLELVPWAVGGLTVIALLAVLRRPVERLLGLVLRTGAGLAVLYLVRGLGAAVGVRLGVNLVNALVLGVLGAPGLGLLLMLNWLLAG